ncbi:glycoside hydrolase family 3 protein [Backusella circina FSU 941]|nr:glycoside hydrolase family 3 protein [Backusella circina FSU 941]
MHIPSLSAAAVGVLFTLNSVAAKNYEISWDAAYKKAEALVGKMSLEQKVNLGTGVGWANGVCVGNTYATTNPDFPSLCLQDGPLGIRVADNITAGIAGINSASTFDRDLMLQRGEYMGNEFRAKGIHIQLGPGMNLMRSPEGGRGWESGGEDPFLTGVTGAETIKGIQSQGVIATAKHFILNDQEQNRNTASSDVDPKTFHEIYVWPFARAVEAGVGSVMCSYNKINGTYACEDDYTMNTVLKGELGFRGFVQSDWGGTHSTAPAVNSGLDMTMPGDVNFGSGDSYFGKNLTAAVSNGKVEEDRITDMALRIAAAYYKVGQDKNMPEVTINAFDRSKAPYNNVQGDHKKIARAGAVASHVLLRNSGILPLSPKVKNVAFIGADAGPSPAGLNACEYNACDNGTLAMGWGSGSAEFPYLIDPLAGFKAAVKKGVSVSSSLNDYDLDQAKKIAKSADVAFVFANADSGEQISVVEGNSGDRANLSLWHKGDDLIKAVADANKNTVVVIHAVGPVLMPWVNHPNIKAILWPGLPGQESGNAFADIVLGNENPSGRLPYTIAKEYADYPVHPDPAATVDYSEKLLFGYRHFDAKKIEPLFPFGHGLSYSKFEYSKLKLSTKGKGDDITVTASLTVSNTGSVDGAEVVQAYIGFPKSANEPPKVLRGFEKVSINKGKKENVSISFSKTELSVWDIDSDSWVIPSGTFTLYIGASNRDIRQTVTFKL